MQTQMQMQMQMRLAIVPSKHRTFILLKPDGMKKQLLAKLLLVLNVRKLRVISLWTITLDARDVKELYGEHSHRKDYPAMEAYLISGPSVAIYVTGSNAVSRVRTLMGTGEFPYPGRTFRGTHATTQQRNVMHASDSPKSAKKELEYFF